MTNTLPTDPNFNSKICQGNFNLDDVCELQSLVADGLGTQIHLCSGKEICFLNWDQVKFQCPLEDSELSGQNAVEIVGLST
jgi:hypothetical protein